jgi:hypothetical protein
MLGIVIVISLISSYYILFKLGYRKGYSDGIDEIVQSLDETIERMVKVDKDN